MVKRISTGRGGSRGGPSTLSEPRVVATPNPAATPSDTTPRATTTPSPTATETTASRSTMEQRTFPAGSYIVRMDQPYSRIADALLDYQYWSPRDPQQNVYDDTGWTFGELGNVQAIRVTDVKVLSAAMERANGEVRSTGGVTGQGSFFIV